MITFIFETEEGFRFDSVTQHETEEDTVQAVYNNALRHFEEGIKRFRIRFEDGEHKGGVFLDQDFESTIGGYNERRCEFIVSFATPDEEEVEEWDYY